MFFVMRALLTVLSTESVFAAKLHLLHYDPISNESPKITGPIIDGSSIKAITRRSPTIYSNTPASSRLAEVLREHCHVIAAWYKGNYRRGTPLEDLIFEVHKHPMLPCNVCVSAIRAYKLDVEENKWPTTAWVAFLAKWCADNAEKPFEVCHGNINSHLVSMTQP
jgi:hypothetical protein